MATRSQRCIAAFVAILEGLEEVVEGGAETAEILEAIYARTGYTAELEASEDPQDGSRLDNLAELVTVAREFAGDAAVADLAVAPEVEPEPPGSLAAFRAGGSSPTPIRCPTTTRAGHLMTLHTAGA